MSSEGAGHKPRWFQAEMDRIGEAMKASALEARTIILDAIPAAGKSTAPIILARHLYPSRIDALVWIVPRTTLRAQGEAQFIDGFIANLFPHGLEIRQCGNETNPTRGVQGCITTYQSVEQNPELWRQLFETRLRLLLVLDEGHHLDAGSAWSRAVTPLWERADYRLLMSGTMARGDNKRISFLDYREVLGGAVLDLADAPSRRVVRYTRAMALADKAIKPLRFQLLDGCLTWIDRGGQTRSISELGEAKSHENPAAIYTALHTEYADELLRRCVEHWRRVRIRNPRAKMLVVADSQGSAKRFLKVVRETSVPRSDVAISEDSPSAHTAIARFKRPYSDGDALDCLVTVAMAYEGLDVPACTHLACLTHVRSSSWLRQVFGRVSRVDREAGSWAAQYGMVFGPDDPIFRRVVQDVTAEQEVFVPDPVERESKGKEGGEAADSPIIPLLGRVTDGSLLAPDAGQEIDTADIDFICSTAEELGLPTDDPIKIVLLLKRLEEKSLLSSGYRQTGQATFGANARPTVSQRERAVRQWIERECRRRDQRDGAPYGTWNRALFAQFGKSRADMTEEELLAVATWLRGQEASDAVRA